MKKIFSVVAMATMLIAGMTSCSQNDELNSQVVEGGKTLNAVGFKVNADGALATRGYATNAGNALEQITDFQTWAYDAVDGGLYMGTSASVGRTVENSGTAVAPVWSYTPQQFWPVNALNFVAITPDAPNGLTANAVAQAPDSKVVTLTSSVTLSTNVEDQDDIMFANAAEIEKDDNAGNVPFTFKHALSQIVFKGQLPTSGAVTKVEVAEITLGNVGKTGDLTFTSAGAFFGGTNAYITASTPSAFTLDAGDLEGTAAYEVGVGGVTAGTAFDMTISNNATKKNAWMLLPQRAAAWTPADDAELKAGGLTDAPATGAYLKIRAKLSKDGVTILNNTDPIYIPLTISWDRSKKYIYTIEFNGTTALTPITFSVAAEDWTDADPQPDLINM